MANSFLRFDMLLLVLVLVLAFFLGSFTANNSDVLLHLSLGNPLGTNADQTGWVHHAWLTSLLLGTVYEPLSPTAEAGDRVAVIAKALVVVALAIVLCLIRRRGQSLLLPITCTALAVLVMSPGLVLQPQVVSLLFLGVTLGVLTLPASLYPRATWWLPALFALWVNMDQWFVLGPLTVALWLLGEELQMRFDVAGEASPHPALPPAGGGLESGGQFKTHAIVLGLGLAACLANPWLFRAFTLPVDLAYISRNLLPPRMVAAGQMVAKAQQSDPQFMPLFSPFSSEYYMRPGFGQNTAGLAYFVLLLAGIASFLALPVFVPREPEGRRNCPNSRTCVNFSLLTVFLFFALLSALNFRLIPFFAVVGGPITALNFQDYLGRRRAASDAATRSDRNWAIGGRVAALAACVVLLACAWPGWLHGNADNWRFTHHVAWEIAEDPGVPEAAKVIRQVQQQTGLCKLGFNYSLDGGNKFAWCRSHGEPTVQLFCDARYALPADRAEAFGKIRKALRDEADLLSLLFGPRPLDRPQQEQLVKALNQGKQTYGEWMRKFGIDYVVFTGLHFDPQLRKVTDSLLTDAFQQWVPLYHDGRTAVFGWLDDPAKKMPNDAYRKVRLDYYRLAPSATLPPNMPRVILDPSQVAPPPSDTNGDWQQYLVGPERPALSSFQSAQYLAVCKRAAADWQRGNIDLMIAGCGSACTLASGVTTKGPVLTRKNQQGQEVKEQLFQPRDRWPPAAVILAVRAGRKATLESPNDVNAYLTLGQAYQMCLPQEDHWVRRLPVRARPLYKPELRVQFRFVQTITAFQNTLAIQPDNWQVHEILHELYLDLGYVDLALDHLVEARKGLDARKPADTAQAAALEQLKAKYDQRVKLMTEEVNRSQEAFELETNAQQDALLKFQVALVDQNKKDAQGRDQKRGLIKLGLKLLLDVKPDALKDVPAKVHFLASWQLFLLLTTGQAREAYNRLEDEELRNVLPGGEYEELRALAAAALGDYPTADKFLDEAEKARGLAPDQQVLEQQQKAVQQLTEYLAATAAGTPGAAGNTGLLSRLGVFHIRMPEMLGALMLAAKERRDVAELRLIRGSLALELGDTTAAAKHFRGSLAILPLVLPVALNLTDRPIAQRYLELLENK